MASKTSICNQALLLLGEKTIQSLEEDTTEAKVCNAFYDDARDACLRDIKPNFARFHTILTTALDPPAWEFDNAWQLPQDYMIVVAINREELQDSQWREWRVQGNAFLTNRTDPQILYVRRQDNVEDLMDASFVKALAAYVAYESAYLLTNSDDKVAAMFELYNIRKDDATSIYGQESSTLDTQNNQLTLVR